jgi:hypothetical protein
METRLIVKRDEYIWHFLGYDSTSDAIDLAHWFVTVLINEGEIKLDVYENFKQRTDIPAFMIDIDDEELEGLGEFFEDEFDDDVPIEFEFKGKKFKLELE